MNIRASALPKLAVCPRYEGTLGDAGPAAQRGTTIDEAFRLSLQGDETKANALPCAEDIAACRWAVAKVREYSRGKQLETREEYLRMSVPGIMNLGTADVVCQHVGWVGDLKTGQMRNYREQMAAYALSCMDATFSESWAAHVFYCDQQQVASYRFTHAEASKIVSGILDMVRDPNSAPQSCEYCSWCRHADRCPARVEDAEQAVMVLSENSLSALRGNLMASPERLSEFLRQWKLAETELAEPLFETAKAMLVSDPESLPGWKASNVKGREYFDHIGIVQAAVKGKAGLDSLVLALGGKMGGDKFRKWCAEMNVEVDESLARQGQPSVQLRQAKSTKKNK